MKILHTADWHLGKRLERFSRLDEQKEVLEEIGRIADEQDVDVVLVAGDLFDAFSPAADAIELLYSTLKKLANNGQRAVIAIAGNHDSPERIDAPDVLARECGIFFAAHPLSQPGLIDLPTGLSITKSDQGFMELKLPRIDYPLRLVLTPYANEARLRTMFSQEEEENELREYLQAHWAKLADQYCDEKGVNLLAAHLFVMKKGETPQEEPDDEKPILRIGTAQAIYTENIPPQIQYTALGHLHRQQVISGAEGPAVYSSSPLSYSFGEAGQTKYVMLLEAEPGKPVSTTRIPLTSGRPLIRKRFEEVDEAVIWLEANQKALVELTIVSDAFLKSADRKRLELAHEGIVTIIPEIRSSLMNKENTAPAIDLAQNMEALFTQFFKHVKGQEPNEELLALFNELKSEEEENAAN